MRKDLSRAENNMYYLLTTHDQRGTLLELYKVAAERIGGFSVRFLMQKSQKDIQPWDGRWDGAVG